MIIAFIYNTNQVLCKASLKAPSLSITKPPSIIPQTTSTGLFQTTSTTSSSQFRPTLQTSSSSNISYPARTSTTVGTTSQSSTESIPTSSAWLKNSNIETIINRWKKDLDTSLKKFHNQASQLREMDQKIIENSGRVNNNFKNVIKFINRNLIFFYWYYCRLLD